MGTSQFLKPRLVDAVFVGMVLLLVAGLVYELLR
jgi:hypothetical protein